MGKMLLLIDWFCNIIIELIKFCYPWSWDLSWRKGPWVHSLDTRSRRLSLQASQRISPIWVNRGVSLSYTLRITGPRQADSVTASALQHSVEGASTHGPWRWLGLESSWARFPGVCRGNKVSKDSLRKIPSEEKTNRWNLCVQHVLKHTSGISKSFYRVAMHP